MSAIIANLILIFAGCVMFSVFYWEVFHAIVIRGMRFRLFALRDETRRVAAEQGLAKSFVYRQQENFVCKTICIGSHISLISFACFILRHNKKIDDVEYNRFEKEASPEFLTLRDATAKSLIIMMMANSPFLIFIGSILIPVMWALGKLSKKVLYSGAECFVEELETEPSGIMPAHC